MIRDAHSVDSILRRSVRSVVESYSLIPEIATMLNAFAVQSSIDAEDFVFHGNADTALFAEQLIAGEYPRIPELD